jgi:hypothetical protein
MVFILHLINPVQNLISYFFHIHLNIVTCRRVAKRQLCERSDCETVSTSHQWRNVHRHLASCCATLGCDVTQQSCHGDDSTVLSYYVTVYCWAIRRLFTGRSVQRLYNNSSIQNKVVQYSTVQSRAS